MHLRPDLLDPFTDRRRVPSVLLVQEPGLGLGALGDALEDLGMACDTVEAPTDLPGRARSARPDVVLLDAETGGSGLVHAVERLRRDHRTVATPVVAIIDGPDPAVLARIDAIGVDDYVVRPYAPADLRDRLVFAVRSGAARAGLDPLTDLPGRRTLTTSMRRRMADAEPFAALWADIDGLRPFNERHGTVRGDAAISALAKATIAAVDASDGEDRLITHLGGDDVVVLCAPDEAETLGLGIVARFERAVADLHPPEEVDRGYAVAPDREGRPRVHETLSVSVGIAEWRPDREPSPTVVLDAAAEVCAHVKQRPGLSLAFDRRLHDQGPWARR
ncbi:MAG: diguanylate cyclase [Solirubrobacteraceae bacterium]